MAGARDPDQRGIGEGYPHCFALAAVDAADSQKPPAMQALAMPARQSGQAPSRSGVGAITRSPLGESADIVADDWWTSRMAASQATRPSSPRRRSSV